MHCHCIIDGLNILDLCCILVCISLVGEIYSLWHLQLKLFLQVIMNFLYHIISYLYNVVFVNLL